MVEGLSSWPERLPPGLGLALAAAGANAVWLAAWPGLGAAAAILVLLQASLRREAKIGLTLLGRFALYGLAVGLFRLALALPAGAADPGLVLVLAADALRLPLAAWVFQVFTRHFGLSHIRRLVSWLPATAARQAALALWLPACLARRLPEQAGRWRSSVVRAGGGRARPAALQALRGCPTFLPWMWRELEDFSAHLVRRWPDDPPDVATID
jgi:hypothetical protein